MSEDADKPGISFKTLAIASAASATATVVVPMVWRPGTLAAAAVTPIVVALVTEFLKRPKLPITRVRPLVARDGAPRRVRREAGADRKPRQDRFGLRMADRRRRLVRVGLVTGLLAFAVVAVVWTAGELAAGESLSGGERTTYFGGEASQSERDGDGGDAPAGESGAPRDAEPSAPDGGGAATPDPSAPTPAPTGTPAPTTEPAAPEATPEMEATP